MDKAARIAKLAAQLRRFTLSRLDAFEDAHSGQKTPRKETLFVLADILEKPVLELKSEWHRATAGAPLPEEIAVHCREAIELCEALRRAALSAQDFEAAGLKSKIQDMRRLRENAHKTNIPYEAARKRAREIAAAQWAVKPDMRKHEMIATICERLAKEGFGKSVETTVWGWLGRGLHGESVIPAAVRKAGRPKSTGR